MKSALLVALAILLAAPVAQAEDVPQPGVLDPRIQTIDYDPNEVVLLKGTLGYQFMLEFDTSEHIETVSIGDSLGWQVTPNRKANVLFLKPIDRTSRTNLTVLTDTRRYAFELQVAPANSTAPVLYIARMVYPQPMIAVPVVEPEQPEAAPIVANADYLVTGSAEIRPARVFDDGQVTYFQWAPDAAAPAIFAESADGTESVVNYVVRGPYTVVDQISPRFVLRNGSQVAIVANQTLPQEAERGRR